LSETINGEETAAAEQSVFCDFAHQPLLDGGEMLPLESSEPSIAVLLGVGEMGNGQAQSIKNVDAGIFGQPDLAGRWAPRFNLRKAYREFAGYIVLGAA